MSKTLRAWLAVGLWLVVIFAFSAMPGDTSGAQSGTLARLLAGVASGLFGEEAGRAMSSEGAEWLLRKAAHVTEYLILSVLLCRALRESGARRIGLFAFALAVLAAALDEGHQLLVPGRAGMPQDVLIDALGAGMGALLHHIFHADVQ